MKPGRERSLRRRHPWIFSGAIARVEGDPGLGETVDVYNSTGEFLARAAYSPQSQIRARVWSWDPQQTPGSDLFHTRLKSCLELRKTRITPEVTNAYRVVHAESDGLPGLVVDRYADTLVAQFLSAGTEFWRELLLDLLAGIPGVQRVYERSDAEVRALEGLPVRNGLVRGADSFELLEIFEHGLIYQIDLHHGQKTAFYLDQRDNRALMQSISSGKEVLDCFSYTGGFALSALKGEATSVTAVEASQEAIDLAKINAGLNKLDTGRIEWIQADVFSLLRTFRDQNRKFDCIVLDPPKFAPTAAQAERAARGYKDINLLALKLLHRGGSLLTFSCSGGVSEALFQKIVAGAALDAQVDAAILKRLSQAADHPVALNFPEAAYLKGFLIQVK